MSSTPPRAAAPRVPVAVLVPAALALAAGLWSLTGPPVWRDEAATVSAAARSLPETVHLLRHVDAVHGLYYALAHVVVALGGTGIVALRLPSVVAGVLAAAGTGALGRALGGPRAGLYGGSLLALMPVLSRYSQEARPYALTMAAAVGATLLLVRALRRPTPGAFAVYGLSVAVLAYLNLFAVLVPAAHGVAVLLCRGPFARWCLAVVPGLALVAPLGWLASRQSAQVGWITRPDAGDVGMLAVQLFGDLGAATPAWLGVAPLVAALAVVGAVRSPLRAAAARAAAGSSAAGLLVRVAVPWLLLPPVALLALSWAAHPVYVFRYVL
ncbi:glycosyltransferase family 39 protein, partial [Microbispora sp. ATCC PTA-5024]|uniref:glycosyltransferase family 39 protein n=1 Tax=Microbispora sp. ATCC PTA-5024 TaxID=316330 RepID=UPI0003DC18A2